MMILTKKILQAHPNGFNSFMVIGRRGIGKSSYSLRALHDALLDMGYADHHAWNLALESLKFSIPDVINYLKDAVESDEKKICMIWDDSRVFASGSAYHLQMKLVNKLSGLLDTVRTALSTLILTCPSQQGLLGVLKTYDDYLIKVHYSPRGGYYRRSKGYLWSTLPSGMKRVYVKFEDNFSCRLPNWVYSKYMKSRKQALKDILIEVEKEM